MNFALVPAFALVASLSAQNVYNPRLDLDEGRYLKALDEAEKRLKANPSDVLAMAAKSEALSSLLRFKEALAVAEKAISLQPNLPSALLARGLARGGEAVQQRNLGSLKKASSAMDDFEAATRRDPKLVQAWISLGLAYQQMPGIFGGSTKKALACAESLRKVNGAKGDLLQGMILSLDDKWGNAEPYFGRALAATPGDAQIIFGYLDSLGSRETRKSIGDQAQRSKLSVEARRLLPSAKGKARAMEAVSLAFLDAGESEEAWRVAKEGLGQTDAPSLLRLHLGKIAAKAGIHREEGLAYLDQVLREPLEGGSGGYPAAHWRRGQILKDLGRRDEARAAAQEALKLDPNMPGARKLLDALG